jgi:hypothetical protein
MLPGHRNLSTIRATQEPCGSPAHAAARSGSTADVFAAFLRLGLTSFRGPIAHLGYFQEEFVVRRKWLDEKTYVDLVALSQFLPRPASSKVGIAPAAIARRLCGALAAGAGHRVLRDRRHGADIRAVWTLSILRVEFMPRPRRRRKWACFQLRVA